MDNQSNEISQCSTEKDLKNHAEDYIVWIDTELTGVDIEKDLILEVACLITDKQLNVVSEDFNIVINQPDTVLNNMDDWCTKHHAQSGLIHECQSSKISLGAAEQLLLNFLKKYVSEKNCPLAGNTIYMDRLFLIKHMPLVNDYLHYRIIDVSTIKELVRRWNLRKYEQMLGRRKNYLHRALSDVKESVKELKYYKEHIFVNI